MYEIIQINKNTWRVEDGGVRFFLLEGSKCALVIDTGMNCPNAKEIAETITSLPLKLLNTHADPDHTSGNEAFGEFYMNKNESGNYYDFHKKSGTVIPVSEGDIIDLGGRKLMIIDLPGHTPGSIAVLDIDAKILISGDSIQDGRIFMFGERRNMDMYIKSLDKLWRDHKEKFDTIFPSHGTLPLYPEIIPKLINAAKEINEGRMPGKNINFMGRNLVLYNAECAEFICER